jgi:hypothetical protein
MARVSTQLAHEGTVIYVKVLGIFPNLSIWIQLSGSFREMITMVADPAKGREVIDYIKAILPVSNHSLGTRFKSYPEGKDSPIEGYFKDKEFVFEGGASEITVKSMNGGSAFMFECSPLTSFQGHNLDGSMNLHAMVVNHAHCILGQKGQQMSREEHALIAMGGYELASVHITEMLHCEHEEIPRLIRDLMANLPDQCAAARFERGVGIKFRSRVASSAPIRFSIYDKRGQIDAQKRQLIARLTRLLKSSELAEEAFELLLNASLNLIRVEVQLGQDTLARLDLQKGSDWCDGQRDGRKSVGVAKRVFSEALEEMNFGAYSTLPRSQILAKAVDIDEKEKVALWLLNEDFSKGIKRGIPVDNKTIKKWRDQLFENYKIDVTARPPIPRHQDMKGLSLGDIFDKKNIARNFLDLPEHLQALYSVGDEHAAYFRGKVAQE